MFLNKFVCFVVWPKWSSIIAGATDFSLLFISRSLNSPKANSTALTHDYI